MNPQSKKEKILQLLKDGVLPSEISKQLWPEAPDSGINYVYRLASEARKKDPSIPKFNRSTSKRSKKISEGITQPPASPSHVEERRKAATLLITRYSAPELVTSQECPHLDFEEIFEIDAKVQQHKKSLGNIARLKALKLVPSSIETLADASEFLVGNVLLLQKKNEEKDAELSELRSELVKCKDSEKAQSRKISSLGKELAKKEYQKQIFGNAVRKYGERLVLECCKTAYQLESYKDQVRLARKEILESKREAAHVSAWSRQLVKQTIRWREDETKKIKENLAHSREIQKARVNNEDIDAAIAKIMSTSPRILSISLQNSDEKLLLEALKSIPRDSMNRLENAIEEAKDQPTEQGFPELNRMLDDEIKRILKRFPSSLRK